MRKTFAELQTGTNGEHKCLSLTLPAKFPEDVQFYF